MLSETPQFIYKVITAALWTRAEAAGTVPPMTIDEADGYMHFSTGDQLRETLRLYFKGQGDLMLLVVRTSDVAADLKWEPSRGGALFPHLYASLPRGTVVTATPVSVDAAGEADLPEIE
jgi:uncharacterized protein (DUF952 family)